MSEPTRRDFLKASLMAGIALGISPNFELQTKKQKDTLTIGNLQVDAFLTDHDEQSWKENGSTLTKDILDYDIVIPEYFTPDQEEAMKNPIVKSLTDLNYKNANALFSNLSMDNSIKEKEIWVLDPAYSQAAINLRITTNAPMSGILTAVSLATLVLPEYQSSTTSTNDEDTKIRMDEIKKLSNAVQKLISASAGAGAAVSIVGENNFLEISLRRAFVAESLCKLGQKLNQKQKAILIYPPEHWFGKEYGTNAGQGLDNVPGIKEYVQNKVKREAVINFFAPLKEKPGFEDLFKARHYKFNGQKYQRIESLDIS